MRAIDFQRALKVSAAAALLAAGGSLHAQNTPATPSKPADAQQPAPDKPIIAPANQGGVIRRSFDIVSTDVIVRDNKNQGQLIANLNKGDFEVYEDGVKQEVVSFILTHGGRVYNDRSEEHTSELQSLRHLVCRLLLEKKKRQQLIQARESSSHQQPASENRSNIGPCYNLR